MHYNTLERIAFHGSSPVKACHCDHSMKHGGLECPQSFGSARQKALRCVDGKLH